MFHLLCGSFFLKNVSALAEWAIKPTTKKVYNCRSFEREALEHTNTFSLIIILHTNEMAAFWLLMKFTNFASFVAHFFSVLFFSRSHFVFIFRSFSDQARSIFFLLFALHQLTNRTKVIIYNHAGSLFNAHLVWQCQYTWINGIEWSVLINWSAKNKKKTIQRKCVKTTRHFSRTQKLPFAQTK